ncbi:MAG: bifunctional phosphopantothenoylcysteine decarboxylase/phosphopantothenate--cysteine ligase CoaBC [Acidobacteriia bacterium]|nr:bifunctional phosphopantothenoylcysteine decarboxylase/phosphopantothenate--cysteine ligase CoaBC [Terriglobia bacterium]
MLIALGVSGGIAAYKACEIVRGLDRAGAAVQVIMTANATRFITPLTLETLSRNKVLLDPFDLAAAEAVQHIDLARRVGALVVAPATANILAKLASGIADDFLSTFHLAVTAPVVVAPAMNTRMWLHPATQASLRTLLARGVLVVDPATGWLAEGESGWGRLAEPDAIVAATLAAARRSLELAGKRIVVTAGPTREPIDPVRFLSNRSSGRMGYALAAAAARRGAAVVLVSGPVELAPPHGVEVVRVTTSDEMRRAVLEARAGAHAVIMAAAVSDFVTEPAASKIKKGPEGLTLTLARGPDILAELGREKGDLLLVGFAAETEDLLARAREKLEAKNLDFVVANDVSAPGRGIEATRNAVTILDRAGGSFEVAEASKAEVADAILDRVFGGGKAP